MESEPDMLETPWLEMIRKMSATIYFPDAPA
jgi:hypothetical protein